MRKIEMQNAGCGMRDAGMRTSVWCDVWCDVCVFFLFYLFFCHLCFLCHPHVVIYLEMQTKKVMATMMRYMGVVIELNRIPVLHCLTGLLTMNLYPRILLKLFLICLMCFDSWSGMIYYTILI
jgi:hypothetical protein